MRLPALAAQLQGFAHSTILTCRAESASVADSADNVDVEVSLWKACGKISWGSLITTLYVYSDLN